MLYGLKPDEPEITTIRVHMVKTTRATLDGGRTAIDYEVGQDYDLPEWLAEAFFRDGKADPAEAHMQAENAAQEPLGAPGKPEVATGKAKTRRAAPGAKNGASAGV